MQHLHVLSVNQSFSIFMRTEMLDYIILLLLLEQLNSEIKLTASLQREWVVSMLLLLQNSALLIRQERTIFLSEYFETLWFFACFPNIKRKTHRPFVIFRIGHCDHYENKHIQYVVKSISCHLYQHLCHCKKCHYHHCCCYYYYHRQH